MTPPRAEVDLDCNDNGRTLMNDPDKSAKELAAPD